jgi:hypothetical protein
MALKIVIGAPERKAKTQMGAVFVKSLNFSLAASSSLFLWYKRALRQ